MARVKTEIDATILKNSIVEAEKNGPLTNRSKLWLTAKDIYNLGIAGKPELEQITESQVMLRVKELDVPVITPVGKRGRSSMSEEQKAAMQAGRNANGPRVGRGEKFAKDEEKVKHFNRLKETVPPRAVSLVQAIQNGSMKAAVKLFCLQCMNYDTAAVRECTAGVSSCPCPLHAFRPFQNAVHEEGEDAVEDFEVAPNGVNVISSTTISDTPISDAAAKLAG